MLPILRPRISQVGWAGAIPYTLDPGNAGLAVWVKPALQLSAVIALTVPFTSREESEDHV